jgi:hypothetical protein
MLIEPKTQSDIEFTRSVLKKLDERGRAAHMARTMIGKVH